MDRYTMIVAVMTTVVGCVTAIIIVGTIASAYRKRASGAIPSDQLLRLEDRLGRIEQGIEAVAVEVERISEGQRFTTKLLSEKQPERVSS